MSNSPTNTQAQRSTHDKHDKHGEVRRNIIELAESLELHVTFSSGKRRGDVVVMHVQGAQANIKAFYAHVDKMFPNLAVELFNLDPHWFGLVAAVVDPEQQHQNTRERRHPTRHHYLNKGD